MADPVDEDVEMKDAWEGSGPSDFALLQPKHEPVDAPASEGKFVPKVKVRPGAVIRGRQECRIAWLGSHAVASDVTFTEQGFMKRDGADVLLRQGFHPIVASLGADGPRAEELFEAQNDNAVRYPNGQIVKCLSGDARLVQDLKNHIKENVKMLEDVSVDSELPEGVEKKMKALGELLSRAKTVKADDKALIKKLRAMLQTSEDQLRSFKKQSNFLSQLAAKTVPKGLHCLSMRLTDEYNDLPPDDLS